MSRADYSRRRQRGNYVRQHETAPDVRLEHVTIGRETDKAILVAVEGVDLWMPLSQVKKIERSPHKGEDAIVVTAWIAKEKGLV